MAEPLDESGEWLTLSAAASRLGWHLQRVQSRARREAWPKRKANRGAALEYLVPAGAWDESPNDPPDESDSVPAEPDAVAGELRAALAKAEARADRLEAALVEARRPWLARVLDGLRRKG